jgi:hypothetical protein
LPSGSFLLTRSQPVASPRSTGTEIEYGETGKTLKVKNIERLRRMGYRRAASSSTTARSTAWTRRAADRAGSEPDAIDGYTKKQHHRQPELLDRADGRGAEAAARRREDQARRRLDLSVRLRRRQGRHGRAVRAEPHLRRRSAEPKKFTKQIAFNVIPHIDVFMDDGYTKEEWKMVVETKKILDPKIKVTATCVRVPVFVGHSEAINIEFEKPRSAQEGAVDPARGARRDARRQARGRRLRHAGRMRRRLRDLRQPRPRRPDRRERPRAVVRLRQSAQGRARSTPCRSPSYPSRFVPKHHYGVETRLEHWRDTTDLPDYKLTDSQKTVDLWMNAIGKLPD